MTIETEREADGRWIAKISKLPGVIASARPQQGDRAGAQVAPVAELPQRIVSRRRT